LRETFYHRQIESEREKGRSGRELALTFGLFSVRQRMGIQMLASGRATTAASATFPVKTTQLKLERDAAELIGASFWTRITSRPASIQMRCVHLGLDVDIITIPVTDADISADIDIKHD
jgi:hypothetical protein